MGGYIGSRASVVSSGVERKKTFNVTATTTVFTTGFPTSDYFTHVYHNGVRLVGGTDFTTSGSSVTLTNAAEDGDTVIILMYSTARRNEANLNVSGDADIGGNTDIGGNIVIGGSAVAGTDTNTTATGSVTLDFDANQNFVLTLTGNVTLANPTTEQVGQSGFIVFIQDGTGGRTVSLGTEYETAGGAGLTLSSAASTTDVVPYIVAASGRILLGAPQLAFA